MLSDEVFPTFLLICNEEMGFCIGISCLLGVKSCHGVILCLEILLTLVFRNIRQIAFFVSLLWLLLYYAFLLEQQEEERHTEYTMTCLPSCYKDAVDMSSARCS